MLNIRNITLEELKNTNIDEQIIESDNMLYDAVSNSNKSVFLHLLTIANTFDYASKNGQKIFSRIIRERKFELFEVLEDKMEISKNFDIFLRALSDSFNVHDNKDFEMYKKIEFYKSENNQILHPSNHSSFWHICCIYNKKKIMTDITEKEYDKITVDHLISLVQFEHYSFFEKITKKMDIVKIQTGNPKSINAGMNVLHVLCGKLEEDYLNKKEINPIHRKFFKLLIEKEIDLNIKYNSGKNYYSYRLPPFLLDEIKSEIEKEKIIKNLNNGFENKNVNKIKRL